MKKSVIIFFIFLGAQAASDTWREPKTVSTVEGYSFSYDTTPSVAVNSNNQGIALWIDDESEIEKVYTSFYKNGTWTFEQLVSENGSLFSLNASGEGIAVWPNYTTGFLEYRFFRDNEWESKRNLFAIGQNENTDYPSVAINNNGWAVAGNTQGSAGKVRLSVYNGSSWSTTSNLGNASIIDDYGVNIEVAINDDNVAVATWRRSSDNLGMVSIYTNGSWSTPVQRTDTEISGDAPKISMIDEGGILMMWSNNSGDVKHSQYNGNSWSSPATLFSANSGDYYPAVALAGNGIGLAVWTDETVDKVQVSKFTPSSNTTPPLNPSIVPSSKWHTVSWSQATGDAITKYRLYGTANGTLFGTQSRNGPLQMLAPHPYKGPLSYSLRSVTGFNQEASIPVSISTYK